MDGNKTATLRLIAFAIDFAVVMAVIIFIDKAGRAVNVINGHLAVEWIMLLFIPCVFFIYWSLHINIGKRLFRLRIVDADTGKNAGVVQLFKRSLLFCLIVPLNIAFVFPLFLSKRHQSFHDMLAKTIVIRQKHEGAPGT